MNFGVPSIFMEKKKTTEQQFTLNTRMHALKWLTDAIPIDILFYHCTEPRLNDVQLSRLQFNVANCIFGPMCDVITLQIIVT